MGENTSVFEAALLAAIGQRSATVAIIGIGYVGLPLVCAVHKQGFPVIAYDTDPTKIRRLETGVSYIRNVNNADVAALNASGRFHPTNDAAMLAKADVVLVCVPTPLTKEGDPDLQHVINTTKTLSQHRKSGQLIVLESTTYPGTTKELVLPMLETEGYVCGRDFYLAYSPEREDPANGLYDVISIPKIVCGYEDASHRLALAFYGAVMKHVVPVSSTATAEAVKLTENIFRSVNIAMVNELKTVFEPMGIDIWEVIEAASSKPFGFMPFYPGPGVGGHCIPVDPFYLSWKARQQGSDTPLIRLAGSINQAMPDYVIERLRGALDESGKSIASARVLLLGMAYKAEVDDVRESPGLVIFDALSRQGAHVDYHDPYVSVLPPTRSFASYANIHSVDVSPQMLAGYDAAIVLSGHSVIDYALVAQHCPLVIDTRNLVRQPCRAKVVRA
jgi:UDP-N-acetyl-D-glucosamine dehydrogenase